jgi:uncharacterized membrane protein
VEAWLSEIANLVALTIDFIAVVIIGIGTIEAVWGVFTVMLLNAAQSEKRAVWLRYARWLVAGLTFQLAADIVHTAVAPTWEDIGRLAAVAVIRTFLTFFLDRDIDRARDLQEAALERDRSELPAQTSAAMFKAHS